MSNKSLDAYLLYKWPFPHSLTDRLTQPMLSSFLKRQDSEKTSLTEKVSQTLHSLWILFISQKLLIFFGRNSITFLKVTPAFIQSSKRPFYLWPGFLCWHRLFFKWPDFYICDQTHFPLTFLQGLSFLFKNIQKSSNSRDMKKKRVNLFAFPTTAL